jgi:anti-anti-sigma factor
MTSCAHLSRVPVPRSSGVGTAAVAPAALVVRVSGEIDIATAPALAEALRARLEAAGPGAELIVDLAAVTFIDARGLATLLEAAETARSRGIVLRTTGRPSCLRRIIAVTGDGGALTCG